MIPLTKEPVEKAFSDSRESSSWTCYLFGGDEEYCIIRYTPPKDRVPNWFVRWMMKICFGCKWVNRE